MTNPRGATLVPGRPAARQSDGADVIALPVPTTRRRPASAAPPPVPSPLARAVAAEHPVAGARSGRRRTSRQTPALRLTSRGRAVAALLLALALWGATSAVWLAVHWALAAA
ncbi:MULTISPECIES: hypothetical protein [unclassified Pseudofrankia]|uniref:hypothetical protein n=1 Tax=unclassified Pseudofrankia TaxID=2994372 RepID=UPI0008D98A6E|nr:MULTISPECIES: hypothetical protein [unclassified Pseudofrankia]MDT3443087.1 hypothetical protein [Pseudofrankia sp. BMG5.37]OHV49950.1 hypothetical protein BCD48_11340 [Pseudofrankia sp. BMG5.36]